MKTIEEFKNKIICGDCLIKLKELEDNSVDSIVTDPPAGISFMGKSWDTDKGGRDNWIKWMQEVATECKRVLKPGGHAFVWAIPRTSHWTATAWENAGFEIRDVVAHVFGSGFPKSHNIGKSVDKLQGNEREVIGKSPHFDKYNSDKYVKNNAVEYVGRKTKEEVGYLTKGTSEWEGWGTALKPAREDWILMRKPLEKGLNIAQNVLKYGTGGINIDESRVGLISGENTKRVSSGHQDSYVGGKLVNNYGIENQSDRDLGRFPADLIHDNSEEVRECFPETKSGKAGIRTSDGFNDGIYGKGMGIKAGQFNGEFGDSGNASRFFKSIIYQAKASKSERNKGLDSFINIEVFNMKCENKQEEKSLIQGERLARLSVDMGTLQIKDIEESGIQKKEDLGWNTILFGKEIMEKYQQDFQSIIKMKTNSTILLKTWNWLMHLLTKEYTLDVNSLMENGGNLVENVDKSRELIITMNEKLELALGVKNVVSGMQLKIKLSEGKCSHPTVKPIALMEYLIKMVTPKGGIVLDPFAGSGTTGVACKNINRNYILIEKEPEYVKIAEARLTKYQESLYLEARGNEK